MQYVTWREGTFASVKEKGRKGKFPCLPAPREKLEHSKPKGISKRRCIVSKFLKILLYLSNILGFGDLFHNVLGFVVLTRNGFYSGIALCCGESCYNRNGISGRWRPSPLGRSSHNSCHYCREMSPGGAHSGHVLGTVAGYSRHRLDMAPHLSRSLLCCVFSSGALCKRHQTTTAHIPV